MGKKEKKERISLPYFIPEDMLETARSAVLKYTYEKYFGKRAKNKQKKR